MKKGVFTQPGSRGDCSDPERLCYALGDAVLCVLDGTRWGQLGAGWLGCKPQSADRIDRMLRNRRHHPFPSSASLRLGARFGLLSAKVGTLGRVQLGAVPEHGVHDDGEPPREGDTRLSHR